MGCAAGGWQRLMAAEAQGSPGACAPVSGTGSVPLGDRSSLLPFPGLRVPICEVRGCPPPSWRLQIPLGLSAHAQQASHSHLWGEGLQAVTRFGVGGLGWSSLYPLSVRDRESRRDGGLAAGLVGKQGNPNCVFLGLPRAGERHTAPRGGGCAERGRPMPVGYHGNSSWWERQPEEAAWERDKEEGVGKRD